MLCVKTTMSITSALIASTIDKIKKDLYQLEDWLNSLHPGPSPVQEPSIKPFVDVSSLMKRVEELTVEVSAQKHTIHHLVDRLDVMEETREIHIDGHLDDLNDPLNDQQDPWLSDIPLQNEIVDPMFVIHKEEPVQVKEEPVQVQEEVKEEVVQVKEEPVQEEVVQVQEEEEEEVQEEEVVQVHEVVKEEPVQEEQVEEEEEEQEEEEEEEEEEGVELEEIIVKGVHYYKDPEEGFIYEIDSEGQPSENPIGVWKTKTQTISFYRST